MAGRMTEFMQRGAVPIDRLEKGLRWRNLDIVFDQRVEGAISANTKRDARGLDQSFDPRLDQARWRRWRGGGDLLGERLALICVKYGKALEEWNRLRFVTGLGGAPLRVFRYETVRIDHGGAALTFA